MFQICEFNPDRDIQATVSGLSTDISAAIESGVVLDSGSVGEFNDIDEPSSIWRRVNDAFEAMDIQRSIHANAKAREAARSAAPSVTPPSSTEVKSE